MLAPNMEYTVIYFSKFNFSFETPVTEYLKFSNGCKKRQEKAWVILQTVFQNKANITHLKPLLFYMGI